MHLCPNETMGITCLFACLLVVKKTGCKAVISIVRTSLSVERSKILTYMEKLKMKCTNMLDFFRNFRYLRGVGKDQS